MAIFGQGDGAVEEGEVDRIHRHVVTRHRQPDTQSPPPLILSSDKVGLQIELCMYSCHEC